VRVVRIVTRLNRGGPLRQLQALVPGLARLGAAGPVWVGEPEPTEEDASAELAALGATIERVPGLERGIHPARDRRAWRWMVARLADLRPDVVHTHMGKAGALGRLAARRAGVPVVVHTLHGHHFDAPFPRGRLACAAERRLGKVTTALVCLSPRQRDDVVLRFRVAPPEKAVVVGPGIDGERLLASVDPARVAEIRERFASGGRTLLLWLGRFVEAKNPHLALAACAVAADALDAPRLHLVMAGDGPQRASVEEAARAAEPALATLVGPVPDPGSWIAAADALLLSSVREGTPIAVLEAHALGRPVVATAVGGVPDLVRDGETGLLVPSGDVRALSGAVARLVGDPSLRRRLGERAAAEAPARFGAERLAADTLALYRRLRAGAAGTPPEGGGAPAPR
jgi:glycosyltransferase involved in cell wall biosynthesis